MRAKRLPPVLEEVELPMIGEMVGMTGIVTREDTERRRVTVIKTRPIMIS